MIGGKREWTRKCMRVKKTKGKKGCWKKKGRMGKQQGCKKKKEEQASSKVGAGGLRGSLCGD